MLDIKRVVQALNDNDVKFIIIGGTAAIAQGSAHLTFDFDISYSRDKENLENIVKALTPFNPYLRGTPKELPFIFDVKTLPNGLTFNLSTVFCDIDLIGELNGLGNYDEVLKYSEKLQIYDMQCYILTLEGLIKNKKTLARAKDLRLLPELEALLQIKKSKQEK
jgi:predicted nucleotidyltransferase